MAMSLMEQYGLSQAHLDIDENNQLREDRITECGDTPRFLWPWEKDLVMVVVHLLPVEPLFNVVRTRYQTKHGVSFIGAPSDAGLAIEVYKILRDQLLEISRDEASPLDRRSFLTGCVDMLRYRAHEIKLQREAAQKSVMTADPGKALIVVKGAAVKAYFLKVYKPRTKPMKVSGSRVNSDAYNRCTEATADIDLDFQNKLI